MKRVTLITCLLIGIFILPVLSGSSMEDGWYRIQLISGHYTAGVDFPPGTYTITAIKGGGNVSSSNAFNGGINAIMGTADKNKNYNMYQQKYVNIELPKGVVLSISGVQVAIESSNVNDTTLTRRNQSITKWYNLGNGNHTAGVDFAAGVYDISVVSGGGNVSSSNAFSGGINAIMGTADMNKYADMYEQKYMNIQLPAGVKLSIDGVTVLLTPSK